MSEAVADDFIRKAECLEDLGEIRWGIIISRDWCSDWRNAPPSLSASIFKDVLTKTEGHEQAEEPFDRHQKFMGCLSQEDFDDLVDHCEMTASRTQTMGSLGGILPNGEMYFGCLPAIMFENSDGTINAYVTPYVMTEAKDKELSMEDWEHLREIIIEHYEE